MKFIKTKLQRRSEGYQPDWVADNILVEVKTNLRAVFAVREDILRLSYAIAGQPGLRAFLLLIEPHITESRLNDEWRNVQMTFRSEILKRIKIVIFKNGAFSGITDEPPPELLDDLREICKEELSGKQTPLPRPDFKSEILKILVYQWLNRNGPLTLDSLAKTAGCNYRTLANTLEWMGNAIIRSSSRSVELKYFPEEAWEWLLVNSRKSRLTKRYSDYSGQPRSIESLFKRLDRMQLKNIAVAGIPGARHYYPDIDLIGIPRLDLAVHCPEKYLNIDFIEKLDPALKLEEDPDKPASIVLHFIRRKDSLFETNPLGIAWADPVECLLDLHEMRLEPQALEFLNFLKTGKHNS